MTTWFRFESGGATNFGTLDGGTITVHQGNMFDRPDSDGPGHCFGECEGAYTV